MSAPLYVRAKSASSPSHGDHFVQARAFPAGHVFVGRNLQRDRILFPAREHAALFKAWSAGKAQDARTLMHAHIKTTRDDLERQR